jgi:hypothetical protein
LTYLFGTNISNSFVGNYSHFDNKIDSATVGVPEIRINPEQDWRSGTNAVTPQDTPQRRFQLKDDLTLIKGKHTWSSRRQLRMDVHWRNIHVCESGAVQAFLDRRKRRSGGLQY